MITAQHTESDTRALIELWSSTSQYRRGRLVARDRILGPSGWGRLRNAVIRMLPGTWAEGLTLDPGRVHRRFFLAVGDFPGIGIPPEDSIHWEEIRSGFLSLEPESSTTLPLIPAP